MKQENTCTHRLKWQNHVWINVTTLYYTLCKYVIYYKYTHQIYIYYVPFLYKTRNTRKCHSKGGLFCPTHFFYIFYRLQAALLQRTGTRTNQQTNNKNTTITNYQRQQRQKTPPKASTNRTCQHAHSQPFDVVPTPFTRSLPARRIDLGHRARRFFPLPPLPQCRMGKSLRDGMNSPTIEGKPFILTIKLRIYALVSRGNFGTSSGLRARGILC